MMRFLTRRSVQIGLLSLLLVVASWFSGTEQSWLQRLQYLTFDTFNTIKPRETMQSVVVVDIDEASLAKLGQWPWPRDMVGALVAKLKAMGAASVAFDMVFAEADRTSPAFVAQRLPNDGAGQLVRRALRAMPDNDSVFANSIRQAGNVVTGFVWSNTGNEGKVPRQARGMVMARAAREMLLENAYTSTHMVTNLPVIEGASAGNGSFSVSTDVDGIVRRVPLVVKFQPEGAGKAMLYPSLALEALRVAMGGKESIKIVPLPSKNIGDLLKPALMAKVGSLRVPLNADGQIWVYYAPMAQERYISAWKVLEGQVRPNDIQGRVVMVGTSAEGLKDIRSSPLNLFVPGVEMHINIIEQILQGKFIFRPALVTGIEAVFIFVTGLLAILLAPFVNVFVLLGAVSALIAGAFGLSWMAYTDAGVLIDPIYPSLAVLSVFMLSALLSYLRSEYERGEIRGAFGHYISPDFMAELTSNPERLKLGGEIKPLSVMFTDIRSFTTISESMSPQELINTMNEFLTPMSDAVMRMRGTIDKYMGDAMMAFWNAPLDVPEHEKQALRAALAMRAALAPVNENLKEKAAQVGGVYHELRCGIGVNTGDAAVGNMGSKQRFAYSALGDTVNLASRLEGQTKAYGLDILIGEGTAQNATEFALVEIDLIRVKGKSQPVRIYTVLGDEAFAQQEDFKALAAVHEAFLRAYRQGAFERALELIKEANSLDSQDFLGDCRMVFELRIKAFLKTPPPADWDGVYVATSK